MDLIYQSLVTTSATIHNLFITNPLSYLLVTGIFGLIIGSFLNVVISRLPIMLELEYKKFCHKYLNLSLPEALTSAKTINLFTPRSHCPNCKHVITALENIPIISYLFLKGCCKKCKQPISIHYPSVELLSAILTAIVAWRFGISYQAIAAWLITWCLIVQSFIDLDHRVIFDELTMPMLWLGLFFNMFGLFQDVNSAILGAIIGYSSLWSIHWCFKLIAKKDGMGHGDFKLFAMLGAWLGWQKLLLVIFLASVFALLIAIILIALKKYDREKGIPFGPYIAIAGWVALLWGDQIVQIYLKSWY